MAALFQLLIRKLIFKTIIPPKIKKNIRVKSDLHQTNNFLFNKYFVSVKIVEFAIVPNLANLQFPVLRLIFRALGILVVFGDIAQRSGIVATPLYVFLFLYLSCDLLRF